MPWEVPITVDGMRYPVRFNTENEPTQDEIDEAVQQITNQAQPASEKPFWRTGDVLSALGDVATNVLPATWAGVRRGWEGIQKEHSPEYMEAMAADEARNRAVLEENAKRQAAGELSTAGENIREIVPSLGFMGASIPSTMAGARTGAFTGGRAATMAGAPEFAPQAALAGGVIGGFAGGFGASYRMMGAQFMDDAMSHFNELSMQKLKRPLNAAERQEIYDDLLPVAQNTALWEAAPEAIGNLATLGAGKVILGIGKPAFQALVKGAKAKILAGVGSQATELATEGITEFGQGNDQAKLEAYKAGLPMESVAPKYQGAQGLWEATKEVAPAVATLGALTAGAGGLAYGANKALSKAPTELSQAQVEALTARSLASAQADMDEAKSSDEGWMAKNNAIAKAAYKLQNAKKAAEYVSKGQFDEAATMFGGKLTAPNTIVQDQLNASMAGVAANADVAPQTAAVDEQAQNEPIIPTPAGSFVPGATETEEIPGIGAINRADIAGIPPAEPPFANEPPSPESLVGDAEAVAFEERLRQQEKEAADAEIRLNQIKAQEEAAAAQEAEQRKAAFEQGNILTPEEKGFEMDNTNAIIRNHPDYTEISGDIIEVRNLLVPDPQGNPVPISFVTLQSSNGKPTSVKLQGQAPQSFVGKHVTVGGRDLADYGNGVRIFGNLEGVQKFKFDKLPPKSSQTITGSNVQTGTEMPVSGKSTVTSPSEAPFSPQPQATSFYPNPRKYDALSQLRSYVKENNLDSLAKELNQNSELRQQWASILGIKPNTKSIIHQAERLAENTGENAPMSDEAMALAKSNPPFRFVRPSIESPREYVSSRDANTETLGEMTLTEGYGGKFYYFNRLVSKTPNKGGGSKALRELQDYSDFSQIPILNEVSAYGDKSQDDLIKWYQDRGFVPFQNSKNTLVYWPREASREAIAKFQPQTTQTNALQKQSTGSVLQREQKEARKTGSERERVEPSLEGQEAAGARQDEEKVTAPNDNQTALNRSRLGGKSPSVSSKEEVQPKGNLENAQGATQKNTPIQKEVITATGNLGGIIHQTPKEKLPEYQIRGIKGRPATDADGIPTGWKLNEFRDAVELVSEDGSKFVVFPIDNQSSYGDKMRALLKAEDWAIDNPIRAQIGASSMEANYGNGRVEDVLPKTVRFVHTTKTIPGKGQKSGYYPGTYAYESESGFLPSMEGNKFVGELPESDIYTLTDADQLKKDAAGFGKHSGNGNAEVKYLQSLGFKAMRRPSMGGTEIIVFDTKDANFKTQTSQPITPQGKPTTATVGKVMPGGSAVERVEVIPEDYARAKANAEKGGEKWNDVETNEQPIKAYRKPDGQLKMYDGHHRLVNAQQKGKKTIPVSIDGEGVVDVPLSAFQVEQYERPDLERDVSQTTAAEKKPSPQSSATQHADEIVPARSMEVSEIVNPEELAIDTNVAPFAIKEWQPWRDAAGDFWTSKILTGDVVIRKNNGRFYVKGVYGAPSKGFSTLPEAQVWTKEQINSGRHYIPQDGPVYNALRLFNIGARRSESIIITRNRLKGESGMHVVKPDDIQFTDRQEILPPYSDYTLREILVVSQEGRTAKSFVSSEREVGNFPIVDISGQGDKIKHVITIDDNHIGGGRRGLTITVYSPSTASIENGSTRQVHLLKPTTAAEKQTPVPSRKGTGAAGVVQSETGKGSILPDDETKETPYKEESSGKVQAGNAAFDQLIQELPIGAQAKYTPEVRAKASRFFETRNEADLQGLTSIQKTKVHEALYRSDKNAAEAEKAERKLQERRLREQEQENARLEKERERQAKLTESRRNSLDSIIGKPQEVEMNAVSVGDGRESLAMVHNSGDVPGVLNAFVGTSKDFLANPENEKNFPDLYRLLKAGRVDEGNFAYGRAFVFTDGIGINAVDRANATKLGVTPAIAAVRRVLIHESLVHRGIFGLPAHLQRRILQWVQQNTTPEQLDVLAKTYPQYADWRSNENQLLALCEEFLAKKVEKLTTIPKTGPLARLMDILKDIWRWITGNTGEPTIKNLKDVVKLLKAGAEAADARLVNGGKIKMSQLRAQGFVTPEMDKAYMDAVNAGDMEKAQWLAYESYQASQSEMTAKNYLAIIDRKREYENLVDNLEQAYNRALKGDDTKEQDVGSYFGPQLVGKDELHQSLSAIAKTPEEIVELLWRQYASGVRPMPTTRDYLAYMQNVGIIPYKMDNAWDFINSDEADNIKNRVAVEAQKWLNLSREDKVPTINPKTDPVYQQVINDWLARNPKSAQTLRDLVGSKGELIKLDARGMPMAGAGRFDHKGVLAVTYDDAGNVIPLSQRFNAASPDIRASRISYANPIDAQLANAAERMRAMREREAAPPVPKALERLFDVNAQPTGTANKLFQLGQEAPVEEVQQEAAIEPQAIRNEIRAAYDRAMVGESSIQVPIQNVFDEAKSVIPSLTERDFGEQLQNLYEDGSAFLVPTDRSADMIAAGEKWGVYDAAGLPASYVGIMPAQESPIIYATPIDRNAIQTQVEESAKAPVNEDSLKGFLLRAIAMHGQPSSVRMARLDPDAPLQVSAQPNGELVIGLGVRQAGEVIRNSRSTQAGFKYLADAVEEEMIHFADLLAMRSKWEAQGKQIDFDHFIRRQSMELTMDLMQTAETLSIADKEALRKVLAANLASYSNNPNWNNDTLENVLQAYAESPMKMNAELVRSLIQAKRSGEITATGYQRIANTIVKWLQDALNWLKQSYNQARGGTFGNVLAQRIQDVEGQLDALGASANIKASRIGDDIISRQKTDLQKQRITGEQVVYQGYPLTNSQGDPIAITRTQQAYKPRAELARQFVKEVADSLDDITQLPNEVINDSYLRAIGAEYMGDFQTLMLAEAENLLRERAKAETIPEEKQRLNQAVEQAAAFFRQGATQGGLDLNTIKQVQKDPRFAGMFALDTVKTQKKEDQAAVVEPNFNGGYAEGMGALNDEASTEAINDLEEELQDRLDQSWLEKAEATLPEKARLLLAKVRGWLADKAKLLQKIALARSALFLKQSKTKQSVAANAAANPFDSMTVAQVEAEIARMEKEVIKLDKKIGDALESIGDELFDSGDVDSKTSGKEKAERMARTPRKETLLKPGKMTALQRLLDKTRDGWSWKQIFTMPKAGQERRRADMLKKVQENEAFNDLNDDEKTQLVELLDQAWIDRKATYLGQKLKADKTVRLPWVTNKGAAKKLESATPELLKAFNDGTFNKDTFNTILAKKYGVKPIDEKAMERAEQLAEELQDPDLPEPVYARKADELLKLIADTQQLNWAKMLNDAWVASVLAGPRTFFDIGFAALNGLQRVMVESTGLALHGDFKTPAQALSRFISILPQGLKEAAYFIKTGDVSILSNSKHQFARFLSKGLKGGGNHSSTSYQLANWDKDKASDATAAQKLQGKILRTIGRFMQMVERILTALDHINSTATKYAYLPLAIAQNKKKYADVRLPNAQEMEQFRNQAKAYLLEGREPANSGEQTALDAWTRHFSDRYYAHAQDIVEGASYAAGVSSGTVDPEGVIGAIYDNILAMASKATSAADELKLKAKALLKDPEVFRSDAYTKYALATLGQLVAYSARNLLGFRFIRFGANKLNDSLSYIPGIGLFRLAEKENDNATKSQMIWNNQAFGILLMMAGIYAIHAMEDEEDPEKRGFDLQGSWDGLSAEQKKQLSDSGKKEYTITFYRNGKPITLAYKTWPISAMLSAIGTMTDMVKFKREKWDQKQFADRLVAATAIAATSTLDSAALSQFADLVGKSAYQADPDEAFVKRITRVGTNFAGGFVPRVFKDLDYWLLDDKARKYETVWENLGKEVPIYRQHIGGEKLNIFAEPIRTSRSPWSRAVIESPSDEAYRKLGLLNARDIWLTPASPEMRTIGTKNRRRHLTPEEQNRYIKLVGAGYKKIIEQYGDRAISMPKERAKAFIADKTRDVRDRAEKLATRPQ